ncbi:DUF2993 domain-containing protein [Nostoc sp. CCY0012]|uniref:LmeA family phospholipid-binding protein n=1 Tax=Nostoc sp. CCY0012 TaxID=1056123 RepID=UPI0039C5C7AB
MSDEQSLEEQLLSQEAKRRLSQKLDGSEKIDVDIQTDILQIVQGQADGVSLAGKGLVIQPNIRVQEIQLETDSIAINPLSAIFGQIELNEPVNAIARIVLTTADINRALTSEYTRSLAQNFKLDMDGEIISFDPQHIELFLPGNGRIGLNAKLLIKFPTNTRLLGATVILHPRTNSQPIMLESVTCTEGKGISVELILAFIQKIQELENLPYFKWEDIAFRIIDMQVIDASVILLIEANVKQISESQIEIINNIK